jgi:branched-chain amino acid transport system permease protein
VSEAIAETVRRPNQGRWVVGVVLLLAVGPVVLALAGLPNIFLSGYYSRLFVDFALFAILAVMLNIVFGHTDQLFLFLGGLAGASAYTTALLADMAGVSPLVTMVAGVAIAAAVGALVSWVSAKREFSVILISILTLTLQLALVEVFVGARNLTGGSTGRPFPDLGLVAIETATGISAQAILYYVLLVVLGLSLFGYLRLINSSVGIAFETIRQDETAARSIGVDVVYYKTLAGFLAAAGIGVAGVLLGQRQEFILPTTFAFEGVDVLVLVMLIIGGLRTTFGPVIGAAIVSVLEEALQLTFGEWETFIFGGLLIILFLYFRSGVTPALDSIGDRLGIGSTAAGTASGSGSGSGVESDADTDADRADTPERTDGQGRRDGPG